VPVAFKPPGEGKRRRKGVRITILSIKDYAGSGYKLAEAIGRHTDHVVHFYTGRYKNVFNHPTGVHVTRENVADVQGIVDSSDIVHVKGDWPANDGYLGLKIMHKPTVQTVGGGFFRKKSHGGLERYKPGDYNATLKTAFTPDLCYNGYSDIWTPHPIDSNAVQNTWTKPPIPVLLHMPSNKAKKDTRFAVQVMEEVKRNIPCEIRVITGVDHKTSIEEKKRATIYFDQFKVGFYGNSAIEAMQYGVPTACYIIDPAMKYIEHSPIISGVKNAEIMAGGIINILQSSMEELSARTWEWCNGVHSYRAVARQWNDLYAGIL